MRNVKIEYQYDGSKYYGFQRQKNKETVQGDIEKVILVGGSTRIPAVQEAV